MPKQILIVDDSRSIRDFLRFFLESKPEMKVCGEAVDGLEALDAAEALKPDLVILDLAMPRMNGLEAAVKLKRMAPKTPLLLYTLHTDVLSRNQIEAAGISAVVSKAEAIDVLLHEIRSLLPTTKAASAS